MIDQIVDKLNEVRGIVPSELVDNDSQLEVDTEDSSSEQLNGRGRAAIARAAREVVLSIYIATLFLLKPIFHPETRSRYPCVADVTDHQNWRSQHTQVLPRRNDGNPPTSPSQTSIHPLYYAIKVRGAMCFMDYLQSRDQLNARSESVAWFREAAVCDHRDSKLFLAACHYEGEDKDHDGAVKWLTEALGERKKGKEKGKTDKGHGGKEWKGATGDMHLESITNLGECYYHGEGVKRDRVEAARLYRQAAELGYAAAQGNLAEMLSTGEGVVKDEEEAAQWFGAAATGGLPEAQFGLGHCYERGEGVSKNLATAAFWYELAASQGHKRSTGALELLESKMQARTRSAD